MSTWMKSLILVLALILAGAPVQALVYSEHTTGNATTVAGWVWNESTERSEITLDEFGLLAGDDIDALSLGDDPTDFSNDRRDVFAVGPGAAGSGGDLFSRSGNGLAVERDLYIENATLDTSNTALFEDLIDQSTSSSPSGLSIDGFDFGTPVIGDLVYFSLENGSPTLTAKGWSAGDVLVCQLGETNTLKRYANATDLGGPAEIDALSIFDKQGDMLFDPENDYIIYSADAGTDVAHYGYQAPPDKTAHTHQELGVGSADNITALEHKLVTLYN